MIADLAIPAVVILLLVILNGIYVAAEFSIIGVRPTRIRQLAEQGNRTAGWVHKVIDSTAETDRYIATAQLGITLASLGLGMYAEPAIAHLIEEPLHNLFGLEGAAVHTVSFIIALSIITYLHVVVGEMVPKSLALQAAERMVLILAVPMRLSQRIFGPAVTVLNQIGVGLLRLFNVPPPAEGSHVYSAQELEMIVSESYEGGLLEAQEKELVANIFDFSERITVLAMTPHTLIESIPVDITEAELLQRFEESPHSRLPVYEDRSENLIGMVHVKDVIRQHLGDDPFDLRSMLRPLPHIPEAMPIDDLLESFQTHHQQMAAVIDERGSLSGLITLEDLLEEVFGELQDEFDTSEVPPIVMEKPGEMLAAGHVPIENIEQYADLGEHRQDIHTIGGLTIAELNKKPEVGDEITLADVRIRIEEVDEYAIKRVRLFY